MLVMMQQAEYLRCATHSRVLKHSEIDEKKRMNEKNVVCLQCTLLRHKKELSRSAAAAAGKMRGLMILN